MGEPVAEPVEVSSTTRRGAPYLRASRLIAVAGAIMILSALVATASPAHAQVPVNCGGMMVVIDHGELFPFVLPDSAGDTLRLGPDDQLHVRVVNIPESGKVELGLLLPFGTRLSRVETWSGLVPGSAEEFDIDVTDFSGWVRGAFNVEVTLFDGVSALCTVPFIVRLDGFGGLAGPVAAAAAVASGIAVVAVGAWGAQGAGANIRVRIAVQRRRPSGWRRWVPVLAWKRTLIATLLGVIAGIVTTTLLQQAGQVRLESAVLVQGAISGGGVSFGFSVVWASVITFFKSPVAPEHENLPPGDSPTPERSEDEGAGEPRGEIDERRPEDGPPTDEGSPPATRTPPTP